MKLGIKQNLKIIRKTDFGVYLTDEKEEVLLPNNQLDSEIRLGEEIEVFLYKDSEDRIIATRLNPLITLGEIKKLKVKEVTDIGAFLDWGLPKDLLLPFKEQTYKINPEDNILVYLYIDISNRLCATMDIYSKLSHNSPYKIDDKVEGTVYQIHPQYGAYVAIDDKYSALIPKKEISRAIKEGDIIAGRVLNIKEDGKLDISLREKAYIQMNSDSELILNRLKKEKILFYHDKSNADEIKKEFSMSKAAFKRAIGRLFKERLINIKEDRIELR